MTDKVIPGKAAPGLPSAARADKSKALQRIPVLKRGIAVTSVVVFGVLSGLAASHQVGSAQNAGASPSSSAAPQSVSPSRTDPAYYSQGQDDGRGQGNGQS